MITRVTITGADDNTPISALAELSAEFPFVEWGILVSRAREGTTRYPSRSWCTHLDGASLPKISMHVCGTWARASMAGILDWRELPDIRYNAKRIQINGAPDPDVRWSSDSFQVPGVQFIFQVPNGLEFAAYLKNEVLGIRPDVALLFDGSGGRGVTPMNWRPRIDGFPCGYAGGISPDNVAEVVSKIPSDQPFWIDMEGRVRDDQERLDLTKVRRVLEVCAPLIAP